MPAPSVTVNVANPGLQAVLAKGRLQSVDVLRGAIMVIMALDHCRDFTHAPALARTFQPEDLTRASSFLFLTRWITHFCAPVFMLTAGLGAYFWARRGKTTAELSRFLLLRGLWLIFLEVTVSHLALFFNFDYSVLVVVILWALGGSMIALAGLVWLPARLLLPLSLVVILGHNLFDKIPAERFGSAAGLWNVLHQQGLFRLFGQPIFIAYPLVPWIAVMAAGFALGPVFQWEPARRRRVLVAIGISLTIAFVINRALNVYGDPRPWAAQASPLFTVLSFLNCAKYPPSLDFLLMTLGPALAVLGWLDRVSLSAANPLVVFGRVPLFYFLAHLFLYHGAGVILGHWVPGGFGLTGVYVIWITGVVLLYPVCLWFARLKDRRRDWWLGYL